MDRPNNRPALWLILFLVAAVPRILGAFFLPNAFGDAYVYIREIGRLSTKMRAGTFALTDAYGFWLPLYQFISAIVNVFVGNGFYSGKLVAAVFGVGACLFVYGITLQLTANRAAATLAFLLIALNPLHVVYSTSAMTDVPHAFLVVGVIYFLLKRSWIAAAMLAALAGMTRMESWMFLILIPVIQFLRERRISLLAFLILLMPPVLWFYISWKATGDALACLRQRQDYLHWLLAMNPTLASFSVKHVLKDAATLLVSADVAVLIAAFVGLWLVSRKSVDILLNRGVQESLHRVLPPVAVFFAFFSLLSIAYLTHQQPIIFPRYGLILFTIGIPILFWVYFALRARNPQWARRLVIVIVAICVFDAGIEAVSAVGFVNATAKQRDVANYLRDHVDSKPNSRIFSDEGTVTVMSGLPSEMFLSSSDTPRDRQSFLSRLKEKRVEYLVFVDHEDSTPANLFPELENGKGNEYFVPVMQAKSRFFHLEIWLYQVRP